MIHEKPTGLLKIATVAKLCDCSKKTIYRRIEAGELSAVDFGEGHLRIERAEFERWRATLRKTRPRPKKDPAKEESDGQRPDPSG